MSKIVDAMLDNPLWKIDHKERENPFAIKENDMTVEELKDDRKGEMCGSPIGGWN